MADIPDSIKVRRLDPLSDPLPCELEAAIGACEQTYHECGIDWLRNQARHALPAGDLPVFYMASVSTTIFVALPLRINSSSREAHSLSSFYSSRWLPVVHCDAPIPLYSAIFRHLAVAEDLGTITLSPLAPETREYSDLQQALALAGWSGVHTWHCFSNWIHQLAGETYTTYLANRPARVRNTVLRKTRGFLRGDQGSFTLVRGQAGLNSAIEAYQSVYSNSWKKAEPYPDFFPGLLHIAATRGWLRLGIASYAGTPVAAQIWFVANNTAAIFKLAYDSEYRSLSPGTVLTAYMMEYVIDKDRVDTIDYLTGDDDYKKDWMSLQRERRGIAACNLKSRPGISAWVSYRLRALAKALFKRA